MSAAHMNVAMVIVTFNRQELLGKLLHSINEMSPAPSRVIVVNNASTDSTASIMEQWGGQAKDFDIELVHLDRNTGGAGGFKVGMERALEGSNDWLWVMDDDVVVLPDALARAEKWTSRFDAFMGQRLTPEGDIVGWSYRLSNRTGLAPLVPGDPFKKTASVASNSGCFEGMFMSKSAVQATGLPDSRFFITWDDATYGWLLSRKYRVGYVKDVFLSRTIEVKSMGPKSFTVYSRNNLGRYYFIRNRAIQAKYFASEGSLHRFLFGLGTLRVVMIEIARTIVVERNLGGLKPIFKAVRDMMLLNRDRQFRIPESP